MAKLKGSTSTLALAAAFAFAVPAEIQAQSVNWQGFYIGAHLGGGEMFTDGIQSPGSDSQLDYDQLDMRGIVAGVHAGYNWDFEDFVFGIEGDFSYTEWEDNEGSLTSSDQDAEAALNFLGSIRAKLGIPVGMEREFLPYITGGIAFIDGDTFNREDGPGTTVSNRRSLHDVGAVVGAGVEWAPHDVFRLRLEGLYYHFDRNVTVPDSFVHIIHSKLEQELYGTNG